jgi:hypothetical protein
LCQHELSLADIRLAGIFSFIHRLRKKILNQYARFTRQANLDYYQTYLLGKDHAIKLDIMFEDCKTQQCAFQELNQIRSSVFVVKFYNMQARRIVERGKTAAPAFDQSR